MENPERFWGSLARQSLNWIRDFDHVMDCDMEEGRIAWFLGGKLNVTGIICIDNKFVSRKSWHSYYTVGENQYPLLTNIILLSPWSPVVSPGLQGSLLVSPGLQWSLVVSLGLQWSPLVSRGLSWSPVVSFGLQRSLLVSLGLAWSPLVSRGLCWSPMVSHGLQGSLMVSSSLPWSPGVPRSL